MSCIEFNHTTYSEEESVGLLSVTLQLTGELQLFPVNMIILTTESATGSTTGMILVFELYFVLARKYYENTYADKSAFMNSLKQSTITFELA